MIKEFLQEALKEDVGRGDLFAPLAKSKRATAKIVSKSRGVLAGMLYLKELCLLQDITLEVIKNDGETLEEKDVIATLNGNIATLLSSERVALNILQHASGIATNTAKYVEILGESKIKLLDTRKTRPLLRALEKYAVRVGGGVNHRMGLDDSLMIKDTHLATIDNLEEFVKKARKSIPFTSKIECECESVEMAKNALEAGVDIIMCDNMQPQDIKGVIALKDAINKNTLIEVSGNVALDTLPQLASLKIDAISSGSLIHQATWLDMSMRIDR
ncbi:MAG: carboxylating nicotinate-nucleotide diphosphorylase [Campylobacterales bacterium]